MDFRNKLVNDSGCRCELRHIQYTSQNAGLEPPPRSAVRALGGREGEVRSVLRHYPALSGISLSFIALSHQNTLGGRTEPGRLSEDCVGGR